MKKLLAVLLSLAMILALAACGDNTNTTTTAAPAENTTAAQTTQAQTQSAGTDYANFKIGFIFLHDPASSTYDNNFYQAALEVQKELGLSDDQCIFKWNVPEGPECQDTAEEMADAGCKIVFADSFGHETYMIEAAKNYPDVQFCHATGTQSRTVGVANYHNAFASIYEGRYLAGIAAGMKLAELVKAGATPKIGYVGAFPYAEVVSGYTSFFLGVRSIVPDATMEVVYTNSWFDIALEKEAALNLINDGCVLLSQHADSEGAPKACEEKGVPNVAYNVSTINPGPTTALISSKINWAPYMEMAIAATMAGESFDTDWSQGFNEGSVELTELNGNVAAEGTAEKLEEVIAAFKAGELHVFDTSTFTVNGMTPEEYVATADYLEDTANGGFNAAVHAIAAQYVTDGYFHESEFRSAPYFDLPIDGITVD